MHDKSKLLLGAHISIAGGFEKSIERGASIQCTAIQIFTKSNRQWHAKPLKKEEIEAFLQVRKETPRIQSVVAHASYLINLAAPDKTIEEKSKESLLIELERCKLLEIPYLVLHPGAYGTSKLEVGIAKIAQNLNYIFDQHNGTTQILLENTAGQGSVIGSTFEQLAEIYHKIEKKDAIGFCFDTCHAFAAGYDFSMQESYEHVWHTFDTTLGINNLKTIHMNDSKKERGSNVDRHADIGKGNIGLEAFRLMMNDHRFFAIPKILETPKETLEDDKKNLTILKELLSEETKKILQH